MKGLFSILVVVLMAASTISCTKKKSAGASSSGDPQPTQLLNSTNFSVTSYPSIEAQSSYTDDCMVYYNAFTDRDTLSLLIGEGDIVNDPTASGLYFDVAPFRGSELYWIRGDSTSDPGLYSGNPDDEGFIHLYLGNLVGNGRSFQNSVGSDIVSSNDSVCSIDVDIYGNRMDGAFSCANQWRYDWSTVGGGSWDLIETESRGAFGSFSCNLIDMR